MKIKKAVRIKFQRLPVQIYIENICELMTRYTLRFSKVVQKCTVRDSFF